MKIKGLTISELRAAVEHVSNINYSGNITFKREPEQNGNFINFTLTVKDSSQKGGRRSNTGRRIAAACWHAHRDIMVRIFSRHPDALLVTVMARYEGLDGFTRLFPATGKVNLGSMYEPLLANRACKCWDDTWSES